MHRRASRTRISATIVKETAAIFGKATETCEQTVRMCGKTRGAFVLTGNNCSVMNTLGPTPDNSNTTGQISVTPVKMSKAIVRIYEAIGRTGEEIGMISEQIDRIGIRIGRV